MNIYATPVPCSHLAAYYKHRWSIQKCLAFKLLWLGYFEWSTGIIQPDVNNLF